MRETFFATCAPGLEPLLHGELAELRLAKLERQVGGVRFEGSLEDAWGANLWSRTAVRVLLRLARFEAANADALYAGAMDVAWGRFLRPDGTFRVDAQSNASILDHTLFVEQRVKDAVADSFRSLHGSRPSVDLEDPDLSIHVHLFRDRCTLSVDTSGDSLHKRGWRKFQGRAPLAETLAAGIVLLSGWDRRSPLVDPFCGSGTILIEAAWIAGGVAPGHLRRSFGFERWIGHQAERWRALVAASRARASWPARLVLEGSDSDAHAIEGARENLAAAGLEGRVRLEVRDVALFAPKRGWNAWIVTNPPYGERVGRDRDLDLVYRRFGALLRERCGGYHAAILSGNPALAQALGLEPERRTALKNGSIDCELLEIPLPATKPA
jgi:23S rRNA (guanine2445-N2)-methyltransferase / 23S rRNA (guanine2069-N7)-methyltransferase